MINCFGGGGEGVDLFGLILLFLFCLVLLCCCCCLVVFFCNGVVQSRLHEFSQCGLEKKLAADLFSLFPLVFNVQITVSSCVYLKENPLIL